MKQLIDLHEKYGLDRVINACGTYTPLGVSRSPSAVGESVAAALGQFFIIDQLQRVVSNAIADDYGAEAAAVIHCAAAGITLGIAGIIAGESAEAVAGLPGIIPAARNVVIPGTHIINYGHEITQDIALTGARTIVAGTDEACGLEELATSLNKENIGCLLLVSSRLIRDQSLDLKKATALAHDRQVPVLIDGAAQDMRIEALLETDADLLVISAHKYLAAATAGLIIGKKAYVEAARAHEKGIGRAMKATKEALAGVLAALEVRSKFDFQEWHGQQSMKVRDFVIVANRITGVTASAEPDPTGLPFQRVVLQIRALEFGKTATELAAGLRALTPPVYVMDHDAANGVLMLEILTLERHEITGTLESIRGLGNG